MTVFKNNVDFRKNKIFFGEELNTQNLMSSNILYLTNSLKDSWVSFGDRRSVFTKDRSDYQTLNDAQKHIFTSNLRYQTLLDSVQGRAPSIAFLHL